jgi:ferredoxin-NADP reductase
MQPAILDPATTSRPPAGRRAVDVPNATLVHRGLLTDSIALLHVRPDDGPLPFDAGQYVSIGLRVGDLLLQRPYSPANRPGSGPDLELLIRRVPEGRLTPLLWELPIGARLRIGRPKGLFRLLPDDPRAHLFVATGTGLAPMISMIGTLVARPDPPPVTLLHGVRYETEMAFGRRIGAWVRGGRVRHVAAVSRPRADGPWWPGPSMLRGRLPDLMPTVWGLLAHDPTTTVAYLCGNPAVVQRVGDFLLASGVDPAAVRREEYWPAA